MIDDRTTQQLSCNYEPRYVEFSGSRAGLQAFAHLIIHTETIRMLRLVASEASEFFKNNVREIAVHCTDGAVQLIAEGDLLRVSGDRGRLAMFAFSIRNLANSEKSSSGNHVHFEPGADECMADNSWSVVVELK